MTVREMVRGLMRAAEFKEQEEDGRIWDDECRRALDAARARGWGLNRIGSLVDDEETTHEERQKLRELALMAVNSTRLAGNWELQTSNSFRRIGTHGDGDVLCAITQRSDGHPDLLAPAGVLEYIVAAQPRVVLELLDYIDEFARDATAVRAEFEGIASTIECVSRDCLDSVTAMHEVIAQVIHALAAPSQMKGAR